MAGVADADAPDRLAGLVRRVRAGEQSAFREMVETFSPPMTQVCYVVCGDDDLADQAVAAAWPIAWQRMSGLREPSRLRTWLVAIAANEARQLMRARRRRAVREIAFQADEPSHSVDRAGLVDLANALARLPPEDRQLLALRYVAGFDSNELARAIGLSPSGTRARLGRLLQRLRTELRDE